MTTQTARIVRFHSAGPSSVLVFDELPLVAPGENEIRIQVQALGLNRAEIMFREGQYLETPVFPSRLGSEASGIVDALGKNVTGFKLGDRVSTIPSFSMGTYGVYGESAVVPASAVAKYPDSLTPEQGTSIWMQFITAYGALIKIGNLQKGQTVLITAASSSVGVAAIQIAKQAGATAIATTRKPDKKDFLLESGADFVIVTEEMDLVESVMAHTNGNGANLVFDPIGGDIVEKLAEASAVGATIIEYGALAGEATPFPLFPALAKGLSIRGYTLFEITQNEALLKPARELIFQGLERGELKPVIDRTFTLDEIREAQDYMASNQQMGKIVVTV
jgi:NADPH:quinone reductase-like Zn-dependent oxidoreductase